MNRQSDIPSPRVARLVSVALLVVLVTGCSPFGEVTTEDDEWVREYGEATSYDPPRARTILERLVRTAPTDEKRRDAEFDLAKMALKDGDVEAARQGFEELYDEDPDDNVASRSLYELGRIAAEHDRDFARARRLLRETIVETPPWAGSELALQFLIRTERDHDRTEALVADLEEMAEELEDDRTAAQLHFERGRLLDEVLDRPEPTLRAWRVAYDRCRDCAATDEALYQMGRLYVRLQQFAPAVQVLEIVADRTQRSWFIGTYSSQRASDARYLLGFVELVYRGNYDAAAAHFEEFLDWFDSHPDANRVAWHLVNIERLDGSERSYRRALEDFIDDHPESRFADRARNQLAELS